MTKRKESRSRAADGRLQSVHTLSVRTASLAVFENDLAGVSDVRAMHFALAEYWHSLINAMYGYVMLDLHICVTVMSRTPSDLVQQTQARRYAITCQNWAGIVPTPIQFYLVCFLHNIWSCIYTKRLKFCTTSDFLFPELITPSQIKEHIMLTSFRVYWVSLNSQLIKTGCDNSIPTHGNFQLKPSFF